MAIAARVHYSKMMNVSNAYDVPVIDYDRDGTGILIAVGSGMMLATMDQIESLRWCVDIGGGRIPNKLAEWAYWIDRIADFVVVSAWFSVTNPTALIDALKHITHIPVLVKSNVDLGTGTAYQSLDDIEHVIATRSYCVTCE